MSSALDALFFVFSWAYVLLAPYSKVEESFNIHATHDILTRGLSLDALKNVSLKKYESYTEWDAHQCIV